MKKILIASGSPIERKFLSKIVEELGFVVDTAKDKEEILSNIKNNRYELVILDSKILKKEGLNLVKEILNLKQVKILILASKEDLNIALQAIDEGALDFIEKPASIAVSLNTIEKELKEKINQLTSLKKYKTHPHFTSEKLKKDTDTETQSTTTSTDQKVILIGSSTGGPGYIETIARSLPENYPHPICVVQHMPPNFTKKFAERLDSLSKVKVVEASNGEELSPGKMIIGKGGWHLHFMKKDGDNKVVCKLIPNTSKRFFVPSVDEMYFSALKVFNPKNVVAILLTGIGDDGADGMVALKKAGAYTIAESEETAVVYGMPKEAYIRGGTVKVLPFPKIVEEILKLGGK